MKNIITLLIITLVTTISSASDNIISAIPTYECIGLYFLSPDRGECKVLYRQIDTSEWNQAYPLVHDPRNNEYRGSIVGLTSNTLYEIQLILKDQKHSIECKTKNDDFPIGKITYLDQVEYSKPLTITESGSPDGYHLITPSKKSKAIIDVRNSADVTAIIDADYVIVRGIEFKNAAIHGLSIRSKRHDIVIEDCHFVHWGRVGGSKSFGNEGNTDSAIYARSRTKNLTIQRNLIENPRGASNDWDTGHPAGPQAISLNNSQGGNVIRYNEIRSSDAHGYNDAIGGSSNYSFEGSPNRDSDIYGNIISHVWDDAIESEGANMNVRIFNNFIEKTFVHIATACTSKGPLYIFRNVFGESRITHNDPRGGTMIKTGQRDEFGGGRKFIFHNTGLQPNGAMHVFSGHPSPNTVTRNNIFDCPGRLASSRKVEDQGDYDYDLFTGSDRGIAKEPHIRRGKPAYIHSYALEFYPASTTTKIQWGKVPVQLGDKTVTLTDPVITIPNPVIDAGERLPNFNDDYTGEAPDLGAFELGSLPIHFGRRAAKNHWAPWELH
jgi:hypothetical protein